MLILPAIYLKDQRVVRLRQGDFAFAHQVSCNPLATALCCGREGAEHVYLVDLDGARDGVRRNRAITEQITRKAGVRVTLGGGLRTEEDLEAAFAAGADRVVLGTAALEDPDLLRRALDRWGDRIAVSVDTLRGRVRIHGWTKGAGLSGADFARSLWDRGVGTILFTDIERDGMLSGPNFRALEEMQRAYPGKIIASGGIASLDDVKRLRRMELYGAAIGKGYYSGVMDLQEAVRVGGEQTG